jgi:hypothetical protein
MDRNRVALDDRIRGRIAQPEMLPKPKPAEQKAEARRDIADRENGGEGIEADWRRHRYSPSTSFIP